MASNLRFHYFVRRFCTFVERIEHVAVQAGIGGEAVCHTLSHTATVFMAQWLSNRIAHRTNG